MHNFVLSIDKELPDTNGREYFTHPSKKRKGVERKTEV